MDAIRARLGMTEEKEEEKVVTPQLNAEESLEEMPLGYTPSYNALDMQKGDTEVLKRTATEFGNYDADTTSTFGGT